MKIGDLVKYWGNYYRNLDWLGVKTLWEVPGEEAKYLTVHWINLRDSSVNEMIGTKSEWNWWP